MPEREQRHERARERRVVGRLGAGHALDRALAELLRVLGQALLGRVGQERRHLGAARRQRAEREADARAAQPRPPRAPQVRAAQPALPLPSLRRAGAPRRRPLRSARPCAAPRRPRTGRRRRSRCRSPLPSWSTPKVSRDWPVSWSMPTQPMSRPRDSAAKPRISERDGQRRHRGEGEQREREVVLGPEAHGEVGDRLGDQGQQRRSRSCPATNEPIAAVASAARRAAAPGHLEALDRGRHRRALARRVEQDRGRRAAVHAARVDAREEDEGADRVVEVERDRQQQRDRSARGRCPAARRRACRA